MPSDRRSRLFDTHISDMLIAGIATVAAFAKSFTPFYLIGSTAIFAVTCLTEIVLLGPRWRQILDSLKSVHDVIVAAGLLYAIVIASYFVNSFHHVPLTHLLGILIFHAMFLLFGFVSASALKAVFVILLAQGITYFIVFGQYALRFGDFVRDGFLQDVFGVGPDLALAIHQQDGAQVALAAIAAIGLATGRARLLLLVFLPLAVWLIYRLQARTALVALACSFAFLAFGAFYSRRKTLALLVTSTAAVSAAFACALFFNYALHANIDPKARDPISSTMLEIQHPEPGLRLAIWTRAWDRLISAPDRLLLGRGIGSYPIDEGVGPPDWLLRKTEGAKHYPHNIHLEMLYETGILGFLAFSVFALFPLVASVRYWPRLSLQEKLAVSIYVSYLVSTELSGSFAFGYDFQFFLAVAVGIVGLKRREEAVGQMHPRQDSAALTAPTQPANANA
jgi:O-antigen ligase